MSALELDIDVETARKARAAVARIVSGGDRGAVGVTTEEAVAMAQAIRALVGHVCLLESEIDRMKDGMIEADAAHLRRFKRCD